MLLAVDENNEADRRYASICKDLGMDGSLRLLWEARAAGLSPSQGLALKTIESGRKGDGNVWGHDVSPNGDTGSLGGEPVTEDDYRVYKRRRDAGGKGDGGMQGVGPLQLTYWSIQDEADRIGGCWVPRCNYRVGFDHFQHLLVIFGERKGAAVYNGGEKNPSFAYADRYIALKGWWHDKLTD